MTSKDKYHTIYLAKYKTVLRKANHHEAIFIAEEIDGQHQRGQVYQLQGPDKLRGQPRKQFSFYFDDGIDPERSAAFCSMEGIGRVKVANLRTIYNLCERVQPPVVPINYEGEFPNCSDWISNVLYHLNLLSIVEFNSGFTPPSQEINLIASKPEASSHSESGSSSKQ